eukprot:660009-Amphidinium_carterae.1
MSKSASSSHGTNNSTATTWQVAKGPTRASPVWGEGVEDHQAQNVVVVNPRLSVERTATMTVLSHDLSLLLALVHQLL